MLPAMVTLLTALKSMAGLALASMPVGLLLKERVNALPLMCTFEVLKFVIVALVKARPLIVVPLPIPRIPLVTAGAWPDEPLLKKDERFAIPY